MTTQDCVANGIDVTALKQAGLDLTAEKPETVVAGDSPFAGKTVVLTGTLSRFTRDEAGEKTVVPAAVEEVPTTMGVCM